MTLAYYYDFTVKADYIFVIITQITVQEKKRAERRYKLMQLFLQMLSKVHNTWEI